MKYKIEKQQEFIEEFLSAYMDRGFGSLSKREIDVLLVHLLMKYSNLSSKNNHELSLDFLLSPTKIKNLCYEAKLKYLSKDNYFKEQFFKLLRKVKLKQLQNNTWVMFSVEDELLKQYIQAKVKESGSFTDSSFNSEIIKIELNDFIGLLDGLLDESEKIDVKELLAPIVENDVNEFKELAFEFFKGLASGAGGEIGKVAVTMATGGVSGLFDLTGIFKKLMRVEV